MNINEICEMYGNNTERLLEAAEALGCKTDSWYVAARAIKANQYGQDKEEPEKPIPGGEPGPVNIYGRF